MLRVKDGHTLVQRLGSPPDLRRCLPRSFLFYLASQAKKIGAQRPSPWIFFRIFDKGGGRVGKVALWLWTDKRLEAHRTSVLRVRPNDAVRDS